MLSHLHGAALRDLVTAPGDPIDVLVPDRWLRDRKGLRFHSVAGFAPFERDVIDGIPVTSLARTLLDCATVVDDLSHRRMYERAERLQILDVRAIREVLHLRKGHRGAARLGALLDYDPTAAAAAVSELERLYLDLLRDAGLPTPEVNVLVDGYLVDCYWPAADLVVELDSYEFHGDREAFERDRAKIADLRAAGHEAVQFTYRPVTQRPAWVVARTRALLGAGIAVT
jgi:very-short-patch-repair endonuclease